MEELKDGIDIVVINENGKGYIEPCLQSILRASQGLIDLIVVDQASIDGTRLWLERQSITHLILNEYATTKAKAKNQAIMVGRYPWIVFVPFYGQVIDREWLDKLWNFTVDRKTGIIVGGVKSSQSNENIGLEFCMIRRRTLQQIGLFDERFEFGENEDLKIRAEWAEYKIETCYEPLIDRCREKEYLSEVDLAMLKTKYGGSLIRRFNA